MFPIINTAIAFILFLISNLNYAENPKVSKSKIFSNKRYVISASEKLNINPVYLSSIIYVERSENLDWSDNALDVLIAKRGFNSSIGFCQIKIKTAYWIERQLADTNSLFFPGQKFLNMIELSKSKEEIIEKLLVDSINIIYAATYIRIIQNLWSKQGFSIDDKPGIIATLFSIGLYNDSGKLRKPHAFPIANGFGVKVKKAFMFF